MRNIRERINKTYNYIHQYDTIKKFSALKNSLTG